MGDFGACGRIQRLKLSRDSDGNPRGRAFIEFTTSEAVEKALLFHEKEYAGRTVYVRKAGDDSFKGKSGKGKGKDKGKQGKKGKGKSKGKGKDNAKGKVGSGKSADSRQEGQASEKQIKEVKEADDAAAKKKKKKQKKQDNNLEKTTSTNKQD